MSARRARQHGSWHAGLGASELYVVKSGEFEVLERRQGINMRVNRKTRGDCFGEVSLMYSCPRSATVAATTPAVVWVLERQIFRCSGQRSPYMHARCMKHNPFLHHSTPCACWRFTPA